MEALTVNYGNYGRFLVNNCSDLVAWRADSFLSKEPTTLEWLQSLEPESILIDIGANIGIYSIPSALFHVKKVYAVEPELKSFAELVKNIELNELDETKIEAVPVAVTTEFASSITQFYLTSDEPGNSCHQVGRNQNFKLEPLKKKRKHRSVYCVSLSDFIQNLQISDDDILHIKIDVDGIETDVCESLFTNNFIHRISSLQIELNQEIESHKALIDRLHSHGFSYLHSQVDRAIRKTGPFQGFAEYVFRRRISNDIFNLLPSKASKFLTPTDNILDNDISSTLYLNPSLPLVQIDDISSKPGAKITEISNYPPAFIINSGLKVSTKRKISNLVVNSLDSSERFSFEGKGGHTPKDPTRLNVSLDSIFDRSPAYEKYIYNLLVDQSLLSLMSKAVVPTLQKYFFVDKSQPFLDKDTAIIARARHFVDLRGFYLTRHNDSSDTFLAYICPLEPFATTTSLFLNKSTGGSIRYRSDLEELDLNYKSSFTPDIIYGLVSKNDPQLVFEYKKSVSYLEHSSVTPIHIKPHESILLPNLRFQGYNRSDDHFSIMQSLCNKMGHGVFPPIQESLRPILLIDYCLTETELEPGKIFTNGDNDIYGSVCTLSDLNSI